MDTSSTLQRARAYSSWAQTPDRSARTAAARQAFEDRWEKIVDPDGVMSERDRAMAAEAERRAHFLRLAHKSAEARRRKGSQS
jgi:hypothetical protein